MIWNTVQSDPKYEISPQGKIRSASTKKSISQRSRTTGYADVNLDGKTRLVHELVAKTFVDGQSKKKSMILHIDGDLTNSDATNLRWVTPAKYVKTLLKRGLATAATQPVVQRTLSDEMVCVHENIAVTSKTTELPRSGIAHCIAGRRKSFKSFKWSYIDVDTELKLLYYTRCIRSCLPFCQKVPKFVILLLS